MNTQRLAIATAILALASATQAQQAFISQSGSGDMASIEQNNGTGTFSNATINQYAGSGNRASVLQASNGSATYNANATVTQQGTSNYVGMIGQFGGSATNIQLTQSAGTNGTADLLQFDATSSQILAAQSGVDQYTRIQQVEGSAGAYVRTNQTGSASFLTIIQGQPSGGVVGSQARAFQGGSGNDSLTVQSGAGLNAYTSQGGAPSSAGSYYSDAVGGFVVVDATVAPALSTNARATIFQTEGSGHTAYILQYGYNLNGSVFQTGASNLGGILQVGANNTANITQSGAMGVATVSQKGVGANANIQQSGVGNVATVRQF
jgi:trimeric autotransporter adhesin